MSYTSQQVQNPPPVLASLRPYSAHRAAEPHYEPRSIRVDFCQLDSIFLPMLSRTAAYMSLLLIVTAMFVRLSSVWRKPSPPGPTGLPILGNILQVPSKLQFIQFTKWSREYGPIFGLNLLGQTVIVLNTHTVARDLLDRCSSIYNDRPRMVMASEILSGSLFMSVMRHGDLLRKMRRAVHESFNARAVEKYHWQDIQVEAITLSMLRILTVPKSWEHHIESFTASSIFSSVYGWPVLCANSPYVQYIRDVVNRIASAAVPGAFFVDLIPIMKYIPAYVAQWKREGSAWHKETGDVLEGFYEAVADELASSNTQSCFAASLLQGPERNGLSKRESAWLYAVMVAGGADTIAMAIKNCVLAILHHPHVMHRAQAELDSVVGRERTPNHLDIANLPYIQAVVHETSRWRPVLPLGLPHAATEEHWHRFLIYSSGEIVIANTWAMNRDPELYPDCDTYRPERYLRRSETMEIDGTTLDNSNK